MCTDIPKPGTVRQLPRFLAARPDVITIVDSGIANVRSVANMLRRLNIASQISDTPDAVMSASKIILPGVGSFDAGMRALCERGLVDALHAARSQNTPILGICLGMQLLARGSAEGKERGLGWLHADCVRFNLDGQNSDFKVPHMGWNSLARERPSLLLDALPQDARFYFVHSYHMRCHDPADVIGTAVHGYPFPAAVQRGSVYGVQFHPEKSHRFGMALLNQFALI